MAQVERNLTDCVVGFLREHRALICDRDTKFTAKFKSILCDYGVDVVLTPVLAPNCNAFAERFVLSIKSECLSKLIFFGEASLRRACGAYLAHYHEERPHQGLGNRRIELPSCAGAGKVRCSERLAGMLTHYHRAA